jgi:hypothetical protein
MQFSPFLALLCFATIEAYILPPSNGMNDRKYVEKRQILGTLTSLLGKTVAPILIQTHPNCVKITGKGGKVADPAGAAPKKQLMQTMSKVPGVKRVKMRYGPYNVPNMNKTSLTGEAGSLWKYVYHRANILVDF